MGLKNIKSAINKSLRILISSSFLLGSSYVINQNEVHANAKSFSKRFEDKESKGRCKLDKYKFECEVDIVQKYDDLKFMNLDILVDEEFIDKYGKNWKDKAKELMQESEKYFHEFDIYFNIKNYGNFETPKGITVSDLLDKIDKIPKKKGRVTFLLSEQNYNGIGGMACIDCASYGRGFAKVYYDLDEETVLSIVHELGHILGAKHIAKFNIFYTPYIMNKGTFAFYQGKKWDPLNKEIINKNKDDL